MATNPDDRKHARQLASSHGPDLPPVDFSAVLQVLDRLDEICSIPLLPFRIEREFATIWNAAGAHGELPEDAEQRKHLAAEFRAIAERRLRLGMMVAEIARRSGITAGVPADLEDRVIDLLPSQSHIIEREATPEELADLLDE